MNEAFRHAQRARPCEKGQGDGCPLFGSSLDCIFNTTTVVGDTDNLPVRAVFQERETTTRAENSYSYLILLWLLHKPLSYVCTVLLH